MSTPKIGYALGCGGARGFCHIGALDVLEQNGIKPDFIAGTSMGALVGGLYALGIPLSEISDCAMRMKKRDILDVRLLFFSQPGVSKDKRFISRILEFAEERLIEECVIPFKAVACDLVKGEEYIFSTGPIWQAIRASSSIPGVFSPVETDGRILIDGGLLTRVPADTVKEMGADIIIGIDAMGDFSDSFEPASPISVIRRAFDVVDKYIFDRKRDIADVLVTPELDGIDAMDFSGAAKEKAIEAGRAAMLAKIEDVKKLLHQAAE